MADSEHIEPPPAWVAALERFKDAYGGEFDAADETDVALLLPLLEAEVRDTYNRGLVAKLREWTAEATAELKELRERRTL